MSDEKKIMEPSSDNFLTVVQQALEEAAPKTGGFLRIYLESHQAPKVQENSFRSQKRRALWQAVNTVRKNPARWFNVREEAWAEFRRLLGPLREAWKRRKFELLQRARQKRKQKELDYRLRIGTARFNEQMHQQQQIRRDRFGSIIQRGALPWSEIKQALVFFGSDQGRSYFQEWSSAARVHFSQDPMLKPVHEYVMTRPSEELFRLLRELQDHSWTKACRIEITLEFSEEKAEEHKHTPVPFTLAEGYEPLPLVNRDRLESPYVCRVLGLNPPVPDPVSVVQSEHKESPRQEHPRQEHYLVVTNECITPHRLLPPEHENWEELNPKLSTSTYVARRVTPQSLKQLRIQMDSHQFSLTAGGTDEYPDPYTALEAYFNPTNRDEEQGQDMEVELEPRFHQEEYDAALMQLRNQREYQADKDPLLHVIPNEVTSNDE